MPAKIDLSMRLKADLTKALDLAPASVAPVDINKVVTLLNGLLANQVDRIFSDRRTIAASATDSLDLNGVLLDAFGDAFNLAKVKFILVIADPLNTNNVNVTRPASNGAPVFLAAGDGIPVKPGGVFLWIAPDLGGITVTGGTGDLLDLVNGAGGASVTYDIVIGGTSA